MTHRLLIATRSPGKQKEIRSILRHIHAEIVFPDEIGLERRADEETIEIGQTSAEKSRPHAAY